MQARGPPPPETVVCASYGALSLAAAGPRRQVAHLGVTVAAVVHQPGAPLFRGLDDLLLLARGGRTVYYGARCEVEPYFASLGFHLPPQVSPLFPSPSLLFFAPRPSVSSFDL